MKAVTKLVRWTMALVLLASPAVALAASADGGNLGGSKTVDGLTIYLGVTPATMIRAEYTKQSPEMRMHGGIPAGKGEHHVMIAVFNADTGKRVTNASVTATVREVGFAGQTEKLLPMTIAGATTYGNYFGMADGTIYRIELSIRRPGVAGVDHAEFDYDHVDDPHGHGVLTHGIIVYLGVIPSGMLSQYPAGSPEATMHGGIPNGARFHHVMVTLVNGSTGKLITDAKVSATVSRGPRGGVTKALQPMVYGRYDSYGNYFAMPDNIKYRIEVTVRRPHSRKAIEAGFHFDHVLF